MTAPLGSVRLASSAAAVLLTDAFTGWLDDPDWVLTGVGGTENGFGGTTELAYESAMLVYWDNDPEAEQTPAVRSATATKTYTGLPANRYVIVRAATSWYHGSGNVGFIGMKVNGVDFAPDVTPSGGFVPNIGETIGTGTTNAAGELTVQFAIEDMQPTFSVNIHYTALTVSTPAQELADIFYNAGVLYIAGSQVSITRGGVTFDPQEEWESYDFPGRVSPVEGCDEIVRSTPVLRTTAMLTGEYQFTVYRPDGAWSDHASIDGARTYTLPVLRSPIANALTDVIAVWPRARGDFVAVHFPRAVCKRFGLVGRDKDEGEIGIEIEARVPADSPLGTVPYLIHTYAAGTEAPG